MNDYHVYDRIDEASITKGSKIETSRWCYDIRPRDNAETNVRSRIVVQQWMLLALATSKDAPTKGMWNLGRQLGFLSFSNG